MFEAFYQKYLNQCLNKELHAKYFKGSDKLETLYSILVILRHLVLYCLPFCARHK